MRRLFILCLCAMSLGLLNVNTTVLAQNKELSNEQFRPKQVKMDTNHDGIVDRIESYDDKGVIVSLEIDTTGDGKIDERVFYKNGRPKRAEKDTNGDGIKNAFLTYDNNGKLSKIETDINGDGKIDERVYYKDGKPVKAEKDTNGDGKPDKWMSY